MGPGDHFVDDWIDASEPSEFEVAAREMLAALEEVKPIFDAGAASPELVEVVRECKEFAERKLEEQMPGQEAIDNRLELLDGEYPEWGPGSLPKQEKPVPLRLRTQKEAEDIVRLQQQFPGVDIRPMTEAEIEAKLKRKVAEMMEGEAYEEHRAPGIAWFTENFRLRDVAQTHLPFGVRVSTYEAETPQEIWYETYLHAPGLDTEPFQLPEKVLLNGSAWYKWHRFFVLVALAYCDRLAEHQPLLPRFIAKARLWWRGLWW